MTDANCKVVLLGSSNAGKTCLLQRYIHGNFTNKTQATVAGSYAARKIDVDDVEVVLACWDTAGSERYATMSRLYYRKAGAAIVCFDLTDRETYEKARYWVSELQSTEEDCKIYLCGTKKDLVDDNPGNREIKEKEVGLLAEDLQAKFMETSSKTGENVEKMFQTIAEDFAANVKQACRNGSSHNIKTEDKKEIVKVSWRKDRRIVREKSTCCMKN